MQHFWFLNNSVAHGRRYTLEDGAGKVGSRRAFIGDGTSAHNLRCGYATSACVLWDGDLRSEAGGSPVMARYKTRLNHKHGIITLRD